MSPSGKKTKRPAERRVDLEAGLDELYGRPLDEFITHRDQLIKRLRECGDRAEATAVGRLRKPSVSAWAVNQAVRSDERAAKGLIAAAEQLEAAQAAVMRGSDRAGLRVAMSEEQEAIEAITDAAAAALGASGSGSASAATLDRVRKTLRAVAGNPDLGAELAQGRVTSDREAVGFGGTLATPAPRRRTDANTGDKRSPRSKADPGVKQRSATAKKKRQAAERAVKSAETKLGAASKRVEAAQSKVDRAATALDNAREKLAAAERERGQREDALAAAKEAT